MAAPRPKNTPMRVSWRAQSTTKVESQYHGILMPEAVMMARSLSSFSITIWYTNTGTRKLVASGTSRFKMLFSCVHGWAHCV